MTSIRSGDSWDRHFVQQQSITALIHNSVADYGGGDVCLREALANADDARATEFVICLDKSQYATEDLLSNQMSVLQGPSLLLCNNAAFSDQDWDGYTSKVGKSYKASDDQTIGRFGKGALTVYSLTDVIQVSFVSSCWSADRQHHVNF